MKKIGIYIHIPFCRSKCPYCDFYSMRSDICGYDDYTMCVLESLEEWRNRTEKNADTLYIGGGTPSLIGGRSIALTVRRAQELFGKCEEITVECNPSAVEEGFFEAVSAAGVNRISLGMQSAVDSERRKLGRSADADRVKAVINEARAAGINNISLDVMTGVPNQTKESLKRTAEFCLDTGVPHISAYMLKLEKGTYYYKNADKLNLPDEDETADLYMFLSEELRKNGFEHYEISNFAKPGFRSRHNLKYWNCEEYIGIGPSAHSFLEGKRFFYPCDIDYFKNGGEPEPDGDGGYSEEYLMLRLRLSEGVIFKEYGDRFGEPFPEEVLRKAKKLTEYGVIEVDEEKMKLTAKGFLLSNSVLAEIL